MANLSQRLPENVPGRFYVDSTCIDCGACRELAPTVFGESDQYSYVKSQPQQSHEQREALRALLACPTHSIGTTPTLSAREAVDDFPLRIEANVYYCGFSSENSYGAHSYFVRHPQGNWMIDSPRFIPSLVQKMEEWGGLRYIFLTHRDDVVDADKYAGHFGSERIIHRDELSAQPGAERVIEGLKPVLIQEDFLAIPTPGHTSGHMVLLYQNRFLFSGDHLWGNRETGKLGASRGVCWYSWDEQKNSIGLLLNYDFEWVLPGHGSRIHLSNSEVKQELRKLITQMSKMATRREN